MPKSIAPGLFVELQQLCEDLTDVYVWTMPVRSKPMRSLSIEDHAKVIDGVITDEIESPEHEHDHSTRIASRRVVWISSMIEQ